MASTERAGAGAGAGAGEGGDARGPGGSGAPGAGDGGEGRPNGSRGEERLHQTSRARWMEDGWGQVDVVTGFGTRASRRWVSSINF